MNDMNDDDHHMYTILSNAASYLLLSDGKAFLEAARMGGNKPNDIQILKNVRKMDGWMDGRFYVLYFCTREGLIGQPGTMTCGHAQLYNCIAFEFYRHIQYLPDVRKIYLFISA